MTVPRLSFDGRPSARLVAPRTALSPLSPIGAGSAPGVARTSDPAGNGLVRQASSSTMVTGTLRFSFSISPDSGTIVSSALSSEPWSTSTGSSQFSPPASMPWPE